MIRVKSFITPACCAMSPNGSTPRMRGMREKLQLIYEASRQLNASFAPQHIHEVACNSIAQLISCDKIFITSLRSERG